MSPEGDALEPLLEALRALGKSERRAAALLASATFQRAVALAVELDDTALVELSGGPDAVAASVALEALRARPASSELGGRLLPLLDSTRGQRGVFLLRALDPHVVALADAGALAARCALAWRGTGDPARDRGGASR